MIQGMTVFYRLKHSEAEKVNKRRADAEKFRKMMAGLTDFQLDIDVVDILKEFLVSGYVVHYGEEVKGGVLLPAQVIRAYSVTERGTNDPDSGGPQSWANKAFSGIADLKVSLPGNDFLWVPQAKMDRAPRSHTGTGQGVTAMPDYGMFVTTPPAQLI